MKAPVIGFAGMTHLGLNSAVATAERGFEVYCYDMDVELIKQLKLSRTDISEPNLADLLLKNAKQLQFTNQIEHLAHCDVVYISIDVPTNEKGQSDLTSIRSLIKTVTSSLHANAILVILSQVPPGFTRQVMFQKERVYYQVETLVFGQAIQRAFNPERYIIGCADPKHPLPSCYQYLLEKFNCPILPMRYESAELAKISINCCLVASIGVANTLSEICEQIGAEWGEIVPALKLDKRIGQFSYLNPGLGIAGGNLERDLNTIIELSNKHGTDARIVNSWISNSRYRRDWALRILHKELFNKIPNPAVTVLGLSYKEDTHSIKNSPSIALLQCLKAYQVTVYDPIVPASTVPHAISAASMEEAIHHSDVLIIMTPWAIFKSLTVKKLLEKMKGRLIIDPYRVLDKHAVSMAGFKYLTLGTQSSC